MVNYPYEWSKYMIKGKVRTFSKDTPIDIIEKAKKVNKTFIEDTGKPFFAFEN